MIEQSVCDSELKKELAEIKWQVMDEIFEQKIKTLLA